MFDLLYTEIKKITKDIRRKHISAFAAQVSFYFIMSLFPLMILVFAMLDSLNINMRIYPSSVEELLKLRNDIPEIPVISFGALISAWSSGKTFTALKESFHYMLNKESKSGYIKMRIKGIAISVIFSVLISLIVIIALFGSIIINIFFSTHSQYNEYFGVIQLTKKIFTLTSLFFVAFVTYRFLPDWGVKDKNKNIIPENKHIFIVSIIISLLIYIYTVFFSLYMVEYSNINIIYNNMATLVSFMILTYGVVFMFISGFLILTEKFGN